MEREKKIKRYRQEKKEERERGLLQMFDFNRYCLFFFICFYIIEYIYKIQDWYFYFVYFIWGIIILFMQ